MNVAAYQENEKMARERQEKKRENSRPFSERVRVALARSLRVQHGEKMVCMREVPGATGTLGKTNSHFDPTQTGSGIALSP